MQLTPNFALVEFTRSATAAARGIDNTPGPAHLANLRRLAATLEEVRAILRVPIIITSGYRSLALNRAVDGSTTSDHSNGLAADFVAPRFGSVRDVCEAIRASPIAFDQLIYEQGPRSDWVHLGIGSRMHRQVLSWTPGRGYANGIVSMRG
ncbi:peptidase M15 [Verticiella sediminum]|uniref:Peptidase M15 n=1 Tax=Verticiella sediminum TaxID=1247510 RepID=A0A556APJ1_9BURK|nr:D-Ala-D-Ala carboxypeptidase family metallohydrolase [Verticiella sediminum]TSH94799.1 peptidase M15 [Verticiella sediminum]